MPIGPGKYDEVLTRARAECGAPSAVLIVLGGKHGHGFACQASIGDTLMLPALLREIAAQIEASFAAGKL